MFLVMSVGLETFECHGSWPSVLTEKLASSVLTGQNLYIINIVTEYICKFI